MLRRDIPWLKKYRATSETTPGYGQPRFVARDQTKKATPSAARIAVATSQLAGLRNVQVGLCRGGRHRPSQAENREAPRRKT